MKQEFVFEQQTSLWELYRMSLYQAPRVKRTRWVFYFIPGIFVLNIILSLSLSKPSTNENWLFTLLPIVAPFLIVCAIYFVLTFIICVLLKVLRPGIFSTVTWQFTHWGMFKKNTAFDYSCPWRNILKVKETRSWILVYTHETGVHVIQKNSFTDKNELDMLLHFLKSNTGKT